MFIRGRGMTVSRVLVTLMAIGVVASCIYGMTKVSPHLVSQGLSVVESVKVRGLASCGRPGYGGCQGERPGTLWSAWCTSWLACWVPAHPFVLMTPVPSVGGDA